MLEVLVCLKKKKKKSDPIPLCCLWCWNPC